MFREWTLRLILLFVSASHVCFAHDAQVERLAAQLHVCTVASWMHPNLYKLITSCNVHGIQLDIIGMNQPYRNNIDKLRWMNLYCKQLPEDDLVLFVDAFDVLILAQKEEIVSRFLKLNAPMLMSVELYCYPEKTASFHPPTSSPFKYICTGTYIGYVKAVNNWLDAFDKKMMKGVSDQAAAHMLFKKNPHFYALDYWCQIFLCLFGLPDEALQIDAENKQIYCTYSNSSPCILHANGKSFKHWDQVYSLFFSK
jgi:hypothetical protein